MVCYMYTMLTYVNIKIFNINRELFHFKISYFFTFIFFLRHKLAAYSNVGA